MLIDITGYIKFAVKQGVKNIDMIVLAILIVNTSADTVLSYVMYISAFVNIESLILCFQIFICFILSCLDPSSKEGNTFIDRLMVLQTGSYRDIFYYFCLITAI